MALAVAQPIIIQRAKFTSNSSSIAPSPLFDLRGLEATNAVQGTKVPTGDSGQFMVVRCIITASAKNPQLAADAPFNRAFLLFLAAFRSLPSVGVLGDGANPRALESTTVSGRLFGTAATG
jgi:hypothetical protein